MILDIDGRKGSQHIAQETLRAFELESELGAPGFKIRGISMDEIRGASINPKHVIQVVGQDEAYGLIAEILPFDAAPQKELVTHMGALVEQTSQGGKITVAITDRGKRHPEVAVDEILGGGIQVKDGKNSRFDVHLNLFARVDFPAVQPKAFAETHRTQIIELFVISEVK